jgi:SAM-dependent methyltransferase
MRVSCDVPKHVRAPATQALRPHADAYNAALRLANPRTRNLRDWLQGLPLVGSAASRLYVDALTRFRFPGSANYWDARYRRGGSSGSGSQDRLAEFKRATLATFVAEHAIASVIEFGCGDGNQLAAASYARYIGLDVSQAAIAACTRRFAADASKSFYVYDSLAFADRARLFHAELALSLDVLYHLVEDEIFAAYLRHLFAAADRYVIIYSSDLDARQTYHERDRAFSRWVAQNISGWSLQQRIANPYAYDKSNPAHTSKSDFFIYARTPE